MPALSRRRSSLPAGGTGTKEIEAVESEKTGEICRTDVDFTPRKQKLRSDSLQSQENLAASPIVLKSPRRCIGFGPKDLANQIDEDSCEKLTTSCKSPVKKTENCFSAKSNWNPRDMDQMNSVTEALHVSTSPSTVVCREDEHRRILEFCKACIEHNKAGSLYACGCPGTDKSLSMEKVKEQLAEWAEKES